MKEDDADNDDGEDDENRSDDDDIDDFDEENDRMKQEKEKRWTPMKKNRLKRRSPYIFSPSNSCLSLAKS